jgi:DNA-binding MarR family transcriptional regulator
MAPGTSLADDATQIAASLDAIAAVRRRAAWEEARSLPVPLTAPQLLAMTILVEAAQDPAPPGDRCGGGLAMSALSKHMGLAHSTTSGIVDRLERLGLLRRVPRSDDRRIVGVELTDAVADWVRHELPAKNARPLAVALQRATSAQRAAVREGIATLEQLITVQDPQLH